MILTLLQHMNLYEMASLDIKNIQHDEYGYIGKEHKETKPRKNIDKKEQ